VSTEGDPHLLRKLTAPQLICSAPDWSAAAEIAGSPPDGGEARGLRIGRAAIPGKFAGSSGGMNEARASCQNGVSRNAEAHQVRQRYRVVRDTPTRACKRSTLRVLRPMRMAEIRTNTAAR